MGVCLHFGPCHLPWGHVGCVFVQMCLKGHTGWVCAVALSSDGKTVVSGSDDRTVRVWDVGSGEEKVSGGIYA